MCRRTESPILEGVTGDLRSDDGNAERRRSGQAKVCCDQCCPDVDGEDDVQRIGHGQILTPRPRIVQQRSDANYSKWGLSQRAQRNGCLLFRNLMWDMYFAG